MLEIKDLNKSFGGQIVLENLSMSFHKGAIYSLVGGNGSGKTTLFNLITGFLKPDNGQIWFKDKRLDTLSPVSINSKGISRTFQDLRIINQLTVKENIILSFKNNPGEKILNSLLPAGIFKKQYTILSEKAEEILEKIHLTDVRFNLAGQISYGQQKLLTVGCCIANDAQLLLLDEPIAGIDSDNYQRIYNLILQLKEEGRTILQIEHNHQFIKDLSDGIWFLYAGKALYFDNFKMFANDSVVKNVYLN